MTSKAIIAACPFINSASFACYCRKHKRLRQRHLQSDRCLTTSALSQRAAGLLPYFDNEIVSKLMGWFELLAWVLGNCLAGFAMLRVIVKTTAKVRVFTGGLAGWRCSSCSQELAWRSSIR